MNSQAAFFNIRPYWSDGCSNNPDNGTVVELSVATSYDKLRVFYKDCDLTDLKSCIDTSCEIPEKSTNKNCQKIIEKYDSQYYCSWSWNFD